MLSLAMIRVEPGSTPGIGITITENFFFVFCGMFFRFLQGEFVACHSCSSSGAGKIFDTYLLLLHVPTDTWFWGLHTTSSPTMSLKNMNTLEVHTSSFRPPGHRYATSYSRND